MSDILAFLWLVASGPVKATTEHGTKAAEPPSKPSVSVRIIK